MQEEALDTVIIITCQHKGDKGESCYVKTATFTTKFRPPAGSKQSPVVLGYFDTMVIHFRLACKSLSGQNCHRSNIINSGT